MKNNQQNENDAKATQEPLDSSGRILLVDDDILLLKLNSGALISFGYNVETAIDGAHAWQALHDRSYDLLITDNKMPKVTGLELIKKVRLAKMTLPIILVSGTMPTEELKRRSELRPDATLAKPFTTAELLNKIKNVLCIANGPTQPTQDYAILDTQVSKIKDLASRSIGDQINSPFSILVVDDDNATRQLSVDVLIGSGYEVEGVKDGAAGWEALQTNDYDLVVTDNKMPKMTGIEMIEKLRSARMSVPVIMATGILPTHDFVRRPWLKPEAMLQRPFSNFDLLATVKKVLASDDGNDGGQETLLPKYL